MLRKSVLTLACVTFASAAPLHAQPTQPPCDLGPHIVLCDQFSSDLSPKARQQLDRILMAYTNCGRASVMLTGHKDTLHTASQAMSVSEKRNTNVAIYLINKGMPGARISAAALGKTRPRANPPKGTFASENRSVEIVFRPAGY